jgi:hypothetical protein
LSETLILAAINATAKGSKKLTVRGVAATLKATVGIGARWSDIQAALQTHLINQVSGNNGQQKSDAPATTGNKIVHPGQQNAIETFGGPLFGQQKSDESTPATTPLVGPLLSSPGPLSLLPPISPQAASSDDKSSSSPAAAPQKKPTQKTIFVEIDRLGNEMLEAVWPLIEIRVARSMTKTAWKKRNRNVAVDMARAGVTVEQVLTVHQEESDKAGEPIFVFRRLQAAFFGEPKRPKRTFDPKNGCDCAETVTFCQAYHQDDYPVATLAEIIERQKAAGVYSGSIAAPAAQ